MVEWIDEGVIQLNQVFDNFYFLWEDDLYYTTYINSLRVSTLSTILCLLIGYPLAYAIVRSTVKILHC